MALHDKYAAQGLEIVAFPCNQFGRQENGSAAEICKFTADKGVKVRYVMRAVRRARRSPHRGVRSSW